MTEKRKGFRDFARNPFFFSGWLLRLEWASQRFGVKPVPVLPLVQENRTGDIKCGLNKVNLSPNRCDV